MAKTKVALHNDGFRMLRTSSAAIEFTRRAAQSVADRAGAGIEVLPVQAPRNRAHMVVAPVTVQAARRNARDNTLLRALGGSA